MSERLLLRLAALALGLVALGHTFGGMLFPTSHGEGEDHVLAALAAYRFDIMGVSRSHADFYAGEGWFLSLSVVVMIALCLALASLVESSREVVRRLVYVPLVFSVVGAGLCAAFFFPAPLGSMVLASLALAACAVKLRGGSPG